MCKDNNKKLAPDILTQTAVLNGLTFPVKAIKCFIYILGIKQAIQAL